MYVFYIYIYIYIIYNIIYSVNSGQNKAFPKKLCKVVLHPLEIP